MSAARAARHRAHAATQAAVDLLSGPQGGDGVALQLAAFGERHVGYGALAVAGRPFAVVGAQRRRSIAIDRLS